MRISDDDAKRHRERISRIGDMHLEFERQFDLFNTIVPYKYNWEIRNSLYSPSLYSLLQGINSNVDAMCRLLTGLFGIAPDDPKASASEHFRRLNVKRMLSVQQVGLAETVQVIAPFSVQDGVPLWWTAYNKTKHELPEGASQANLGNVIEALGALVILLHVSAKVFHSHKIDDLLESKHWFSHADSYKALMESERYNYQMTFAFRDSQKEYLNSDTQKYLSRYYHYLLDFFHPPETV
jgi:hypothetical protein